MRNAVTIFQTDPSDAVTRLAQLDSARPPEGRLLVAAVDGEARAAVPLDGGAAIADPFHRTAELVSLLERVAQLREPRPADRLSRLPARLRGGLRAPAHAVRGARV